MNKESRIVLVASALMVVFVFAGCSAGRARSADNAPAATQASSQPQVITIKDFAFGPPTITVPVGTEVTWINKDDTIHTVVDKGHAFKSEALDTDQKFTFKFDKPGTYSYLCSLHPKMKGEVVVK